MPAKACPSCGRIVRDGNTYCQAHRAKTRGTWGGKGANGPTGSTRAWRKLRDLVLDRDLGICGICGKPGADSADHIIPRSLGGDDSLANLRAAHGTCNSAKRDRKAA